MLQIRRSHDQTLQNHPQRNPHPYHLRSMVASSLTFVFSETFLSGQGSRTAVADAAISFRRLVLVSAAEPLARESTIADVWAGLCEGMLQVGLPQNLTLRILL
jgi:hypothetical protein